MRSNFDFSSWDGALTTLLGLILVTVVAMGIRILFMQTIQRRRERENRQINERLRTLIAAYKTLGSSFTGDLAVDPTHLRNSMQAPAVNEETNPAALGATANLAITAAERRRRIRDAVEGALSDVILLGTEEQVKLAAQAANQMVAGNKVYLSELIISLRSFIRQALDLEPIPANLSIPLQGPLRPSSTSGKGGGNSNNSRSGSGGGGAGGGGMGAGMAAGGMGGMAANREQNTVPEATETQISQSELGQKP